MPLLARLERAVTRARLGPARTAFWIGICVAVPTLARIALDPLLGSLWYPTYYPAILIGALFLGWRAGLILMLLSAVAAIYFIIPPRYDLQLQRRDLAGLLVFLTGDAVIVLAAGLLRTSVLRLRAAHEREKVLNAELRHRMKNTLAIVQGLVAQTAKRGENDPKAFQQILQGRLEALGSAHDLLSSGSWDTCELTQLADRALAPFREHGRITVNGPPCTLRAECCVPLVLALHELATNAVKYGALSAEHGRAELIWSIAPDAEDAVRLHWAETNGPPVVEPSRRGFGTRLLTPQPGLQEVKLYFRPEGVVCEITVQRVKPAGGSPVVRSLPAWIKEIWPRQARPELR